MGIGVDITKNERFEKIITDNQEKRILSPEELRVYESFTSHSRKLEYLASRFSSKEALFKATNIRFEMTDISILNDENGKPYIKSELFNKALDANISISISHEKEYTIAFVIAK